MVNHSNNATTFVTMQSSIGSHVWRYNLVVYYGADGPARGGNRDEISIVTRFRGRLLGDVERASD